MGLYIGLISGTSMDGIDAALIELPANKLIKGHTQPYSEKIKVLLVEALSENSQTPMFFTKLSTLLGREFAHAALSLLKDTPYSIEDIEAIGSHGQTIFHDAEALFPYTLQLGCPHTIAELTGITVVADFRTRDLILGGKGAPFAPIYHQKLFENQKTPLAIANIGGIANLSFMKNSAQIWGFDVGPGNCLLDAWAFKHLNLPYDTDGDFAKTGEVNQELLASLLKDPYFSRPVPKSIGKEYFSLDWLSSHLKVEYKASDVQATLVAFTASAIALTLKAELAAAKYLLICGGGAHNSALIASIASLLPDLEVQPTQYYGINPDFIEAAMFAWLAEKTLNSKPINLQAITGASKPSILGAIYPKNSI